MNGNAANPAARLGTTNLFDLRLITNNQERMILKTDGKMGLGISNPRAWQEIFYCNPQGNQDAGLVVTSFDGCNAGNGLPPNPGDGGGILPPGSGINPGEGDPIFTLPANFYLTRLGYRIHPIVLSQYEADAVVAL